MPALGLGVALFCATAFGALAATVEGVRIGEHPGRTRIVLDLSESVAFEFFTLAEPYRVVVDLPEMAWDDSPTLSRARRGLVTGLRFGLFRPGTSRLVLDTAGPVRVAKAFILPPASGRGYRFVLDLVESDPKAFIASLKPPPQPNVARNGTPMPMDKPKRAEVHRRTIVLDPGHGGVDPGTIALGGRFEKRVVLEYAKAMARALEAKNRYQVLLTRKRDLFLSLRQRVRAAQQVRADLFVSIHADSIADRRVRGGAVYTLSERGSDAEADALATKENKSDLIASVTLEEHDEQVVEILIDLAQRETMNYAARFTNTLVSALRRDKVPLRSKPHRFAGFRVLKAPDVPSVLLELGYLTNAEDERYLLSSEAKRAVARAFAEAVDKYFIALDR